MGKDQEFLEAARNGNIGYIEKVLTQKAKRAGPLASLRRGTGVNVQDSGGYSALHHACLNGHHDIVRLLLAHEASPNLPDSRGSSPLHLAAWAGETEIVKMLLTHPYRPASANLQTIENETPLHCAAQHGHQGALALLLAHDADPNMRNSRGETPLDLAAQYGRLQAVQMLIRAHPELIATFSTAAIEGNHQQHQSQQPQHERISQTHNKSRHSSPLPHSGSVSTPSPSSPSVNSSSPATPTRNIFPHTCLHLASRNGHKNVVEVLLAAGVCVNLQTPSGTALHEAALCGKENVVRTLLKAGIDLNATDAEGRTALDILKEFPPHVTKHIIAVINNFRNQMDTDEGEDGVIYRHHPQLPPAVASAAAAAARAGQLHHQKQQHNNHYHFNSNNHLLNHSHSMQQSSYSKQRFSTGGSGGMGNFNGGKSLDSSLQSDDVGGSSGGGGGGGSGGANNRFYHDINSPVHSHSNTSHNELAISPSSSMSSFEPASVSPRSRSSTGGIIGYGNQPVHMSTFAPATAPPKKPPRRNLSVSPTHTGQQQQFSYTSPNHQQQSQSARRQQRSPSNDSPYSHQSHDSVGGMSFDETQMRERQRQDRLYASGRESTRSAAGMPLSSSNDMLDRQYSSTTGSETFPSNSVEESNNSHSMRRPIPAPRKSSAGNNNGGSSSGSILSKEVINCENPTLKSYNPNRKLKRNRNSYSIGMADKDKEHCSQSSDSNSDPKQQIPSSPTNYKQPPTPDHPPPSSSQAERTIHERIRPLSQEYKRRSALLQMQQQQQHQQLIVDTSDSPPKPIVISTTSYEFAYDHSPPTNTVIPFYHASGTQGSSGSLSSSISCSEHSFSTDCVEEYVSDAPFAGLLKGAACHMSTHEGKPLKMINEAEKPKETQLKVSARPPIPTKPILPERKLIKPQPPPRKDHDSKSEQSICSNTTSNTTNGETTKKSDGEAALQDGEEEEKLSQHIVTNTADPMTESSLLSPFNAEEARKKISEIIESFGSGILNTDITPTHDIELDFEDLEVAPERRELALRLRNAGLLHLERMLFENGYDNFKFVNKVFEESDLQMLDIPEKDAMKLLRFVKTLPPAEFQPQTMNKMEQENKPSTTSSKAIQSKGVSTLSQWLNSIALPEYIESFNKHLYNTIESVCGVWDVELQTVLEINKLGHRRRILQSLVYIRQTREPKSVKTPLAESNCTNKMTTYGGKEPTIVVTQQPTAPVQHRNSITGYRKNRPAPQPPVVPSSNNKNINNTSNNSVSKATPPPPLQIRAPSELLLGLPANLRTKWRHSASALLNEQIKYEVYYLGSTVVKELRGTESTRKSIQKFKMSSNAENQQSEQQQQQHQLAQNSTFNRQQRRAPLRLAISHRGVEFIDADQQCTICEHEIQNINCACQDADDLRHFAYITKEQDMHYCHVFSVESTDLATEIILTLGQAFEVAYQLALRDGITTTPSALDNGLLQGEFCNAMTHK